MALRSPNYFKRTNCRQKNAFTLGELLVVVSIVAILGAVSIPSLSYVISAGNANQAINGISLLLDQARSYAIAHDTYVWVGFFPNATTQNLTVGAVAGTTGMADDLTSSTPANPTYLPITKLETYHYFSLSSSLSVAGMATATDISTSSVGSFVQTGGGQSITFRNILQFNPQGEATVSAGMAHWIQIGLQPVRGGNTSSPNIAVIQVGTLSGQVQVFRP